MKRLRCGFTLVELLIVIAIIGSLSATMSVVTSGSTAKAKAAAIAANVDACKSAAMLYCLEHVDDDDVDFSKVETDTVLYAYCKAWGDFGNGKITYKASDESTGRDNWAVDVDFSGDPEKADIKTALAKIKGYGTYGDLSQTSGKLQATDGNKKDRIQNYKFKVTLLSGKIDSITQ